MIISIDAEKAFGKIKHPFKMDREGTYLSKTWKQPKRPLTDEWIKMCSIERHTEIYTHTHNACLTHTHNGTLFNHKKYEMMPFAATWMDPEIIRLSEVSQTEKDKTV